MANLASLHKDALNKYQSIKGAFMRHKEKIGGVVTTTVRKVVVVGGGAAGGAADHYLSQADDPVTGLPEAKIGPAPLVLTAGLALSGVGYFGHGEAWADHVQAFADGALSYGAGMETLRALRKHAKAAGK